MSDPLLRFVHISDTHINPDTDYNQPYARYTPLPGAIALVEAVNALPFQPDFVLHTGDVAYDPVPAAYETVKEVLSALDAPLYVLSGNHDHTPSLHEAMMPALTLHEPNYLYYDFEHNGVQVICLDSNGPAEVPRGNIPPVQLDWLARLCTAPDDDRPLVIATHHNVLPVGVPWLDEFMRTTNGETLHAVIRNASRRLRGVFHGHIHQNIDYFADGVLYSSAASSWCQFAAYPDASNTEITWNRTASPGFSVVTVSPTRTYIRRHTFEMPDDISTA